MKILEQKGEGGPGETPRGESLYIRIYTSTSGTPNPTPSENLQNFWNYWGMNL